MPTVIGVNQVAGGMPEKSKWYNDLGRIQGKAANMILQAYLGSQGGVGGMPQATPQNPGSLNFPSGASTPTSPAEMEQIRRMGGVPTTTGEIMPYGEPGATRPGGVNYVPPPPQNTQDLTYLQNLAKLDPNSPENQYKTALTNAYAGGVPGMPPIPQSAPPQAQGAPSLSPELIQRAAQAADAGDPQAMQFMEYLMQNGGQ